MKKVISLVLLSIVCLVSLVILTGCGKEEGEEVKLLTETLQNKIKGYSLQVSYPDNGKYEVKLETSNLILTNQDANTKLTFGIKEAEFEKEKKAKAVAEGFTEVKAGDNDGYVYVQAGTAHYSFKMGNSAEGNEIIATMKITEICASEFADLNAKMDSEDIKIILKNLKFDGNTPKYDVDGIMSNDAKFYLKTIDESKYTGKGLKLKQESDVNGVRVVLTDSKTNANITAQYNSSESLEKAIENQPADRKYIDDEVAGLKVKYWENTQYGNTYDCWRTYFVQKDDTVYMINYIVYKGMPAEESKQLLADFISGLTKYDVQ